MSNTQESQNALASPTNTQLDIPADYSGGSLAIYLNKPLFDQLCRAATLLAKTDIVPKQFQGKEGNCFVALDMAGRMNCNVFMLMQNMCVVNGKPGLEAKLIIAMINSSGMFTGPLNYEIEGTSPRYDRAKKEPVDPAFRQRAIATLKSTGETIYGPWVDWDMVQGEGWVQKDGSKWKTMPGLMFEYRSASLFSRTKCPNITMGMPSAEELYDVELVKGVGYSVVDDPQITTAKAQRAASILSGVAAAAETVPTSETAAETAHQPSSASSTSKEKKSPSPSSSSDESQQDAGSATNNNELLQKAFGLLQQISIATGGEDFPDDILDRITKGKYGTQTDLMNAMEEKTQITTAYITGFLLSALEAELQKATVAA